MKDDLLLPGWRERIESARGAGPALPLPPPLARDYLADRVHFVQDSGGARALVQAAYELPVNCVGIDTEYRFEKDYPIRLRGDYEWHDIRSVRPFCLAFAIISDHRMLRFVVDLRLRDLLPMVQEVLDLAVPFACHHAKAELFALWSLGLREPRLVWDTLLAEKALRLGRCPLRARARRAEDDEAARLKRIAAAEEIESLALERTAARYGITVPSHGAKATLQASFLTKPLEAPLTQTEVAYCAADAQATAAIREPQRTACDRAGILEALDRVVMPWNVTAAEIEWTGVLYDRDKCQFLLDSSSRVRERLGAELAYLGIANPNSSEQLAGVLESVGLGRHFPRTETGRLSTRDRVLEEREHLHPAIPSVRRWRRLGQLASDPAVLGLITGADGRVHAEFNVLGADSGRTQASRPNVMGIGRIFRPLVRAPEGYGIGEVDLAQIEVGLAAAVFRDEAMIADFNVGDVYVAMARRLFAGQIDPGDAGLGEREFQDKYPELRKRAKPLVLGIIYGKTIPGIALDLGIKHPEARALWDTFRRLYPTVCRGMERARVQSIRRGYAYISGLRRFRAGAGTATPHEERGMGNAYVQGTAALVFFDAGNRLRRLYRQHHARLIIPVHDAFVFEAPIGRVADVAELTRSVLIRTVQEWFPELQPRAQVNIAHAACWNHEGHHDSVERFVADPMLEL
jgi:DNA polymerase I-like protein with 3'-5' exonuclease and polymerase domains